MRSAKPAPTRSSRACQAAGLPIHLESHSPSCPPPLRLAGDEGSYFSLASTSATKAATSIWPGKVLLEPGGKHHKHDPERRSRESRAVPAPDANAELVSSLQKRQAQANTKRGVRCSTPARKTLLTC